ncbi:MAG: glycosyltransferase family 2 protein [Solirubrobacteraceae bacterium]
MPDVSVALPQRVSVAIPVRDGGELFADVLRALEAQSVEHELVVCDSGSTDGSLELAREQATQVLEVAPGDFSHGGVRNRLMSAASGTHVALLTQDSEPADTRWLERLLGGFGLAADVALVYGPYRSRPGAPAPVRLELERWFASLSADGAPQVERLLEAERSLAAVELVGRRGFFTDANAAIARWAWERTPFREVPYAEDRVLAIDMLRAGHAKAFVPQAGVIHSHAYTSSEQLRRCFDEWRGLREVYGWREPASPTHLLAQLRGELGQTQRTLIVQGVSSSRCWATLAMVARHHVLCRAGALLGSRADRLPAAVTRKLSLERRAGFAPLDLDDEPMPLQTNNAPTQ